MSKPVEEARRARSPRRFGTRGHRLALLLGLALLYPITSSAQVPADPTGTRPPTLGTPPAAPSAEPIRPAPAVTPAPSDAKESDKPASPPATSVSKVPQVTRFPELVEGVGDSKALLGVADSAPAQQPPPETEAAVRLFDEGRYSEAAEAFRAILARRPDDRAAAILVPFAVARQGQAALAIEEARRALASHPDNRQLQLLLAGLLITRKETLEEGHQWYQQILRADANNRLARLGLTEAEMARGNIFGSIERFSTLAAETPSDARLSVRIAQGWAVLGDLERSVEHYKKAHAIAPENVDAVRSLAVLSDVLDRPREGLEYYQKLARLFPTDVSIQVAERSAREAIDEPQLPVPVEEMQKAKLETYTQALEKNSAQLKKRGEQISASQMRSAMRFLPQFFVSPSQSQVDSETRTRAGRDETQTLGFSFGWSLADLVVDPYQLSVKALEADLASVRAALMMETTSTYYQRLNEIMNYRTIQRQLALDPGNLQLRQNKRTTRFGILNLSERLRILTGRL